MDLKAFGEVGTPTGFQEFIRGGCPKPLIAAVERFALAGGLEIALTCDLIVVSEGARLGIPEVSVGLFAAAGALARLRPPCCRTIGARGDFAHRARLRTIRRNVTQETIRISAVYGECTLDPCEQTVSRAPALTGHPRQ
jgi:Enoyl-CoA hydratase/isomerase